MPELRNLRRFKGQLSVLAVSVLFILLAADLSLASIVALGWGSLFTVLALMFLVRPVSIWIGLSPSPQCFQAFFPTHQKTLFASLGRHFHSPDGLFDATATGTYNI